MKFSGKEEKLRYKHELKEMCISILNERIEAARQAMNSAQESANSEEKSSAGDKYETGRAMSQRERDNYAARLEECQIEMNLLQSMDVSKIYDEVNNGAVMLCGDSVFFIATGLGIVPFSEHKVAVLSPKSPFASAMRGKRVGEHAIFSGKDFLISEVF